MGSACSTALSGSAVLRYNPLDYKLGMLILFLFYFHPYEMRITEARKYVMPINNCDVTCKCNDACVINQDHKMIAWFPLSFCTGRFQSPKQGTMRCGMQLANERFSHHTHIHIPQAEGDDSNMSDPPVTSPHSLSSIKGDLGVVDIPGGSCCRVRS